MTKVKNENIDYVYDIFIYENDNEDCIIDEIRNEIGDEEVSSNDENYAYNDYPDDFEVDDNECDFYREWEDDDEIEIRKRFEGYKLSPDYGSEEEEDDYHLKYHIPNDPDSDDNHESWHDK